MLENGKMDSDTATEFSFIQTARDTKACGTKTTNTALESSLSKMEANTSAASTAIK